MLTDGVDLHGAKLRPWYERPQQPFNVPENK